MKKEISRRSFIATSLASIVLVRENGCEKKDEKPNEPKKSIPSKDLVMKTLQSYDPKSRPTPEMIQEKIKKDYGSELTVPEVQKYLDQFVLDGKVNEHAYCPDHFTYSIRA